MSGKGFEFPMATSKRGAKVNAVTSTSLPNGASTLTSSGINRITASMEAALRQRLSKEQKEQKYCNQPRTIRDCRNSIRDQRLRDRGAARQSMKNPKSELKVSKPIQVPELAGEQEDTFSREMSTGILKIEQEIQRRHKRKIQALVVRMTVLVVVPTLCVFAYFFAAASPTFTTRAEFLVVEGYSGDSAEDLSSAFTSRLSQEAIAVQSHLSSREATELLLSRHPLIEQLTDPRRTWFERVTPSMPREAIHARVQSMITVSYDPNEGLVRLSVTAYSKEMSADIARTLTSLAEKKVNDIHLQGRRERLAIVEGRLLQAERELMEAQEAAINLRERLGILDASSEIEMLLSKVEKLQGLTIEKELQLNLQEQNARPNPGKRRALKLEIEVLKKLTAEARLQLTDREREGMSFAEVSARLQYADQEVDARIEFLRDAQSSWKAAEEESRSKSRFLALSVAPVPPETATGPDTRRMTLIALLSSLSIYLLGSITFGILKDQVTS